MLDGKRPTAFSLGMPCRREMEEPDRYLVKIMPHARLRVESQIASALLPGEAGLHVAVSNGRREILGQDFPVAIVAGQFPAMDASFARVDETVVVSPGQLLLSQAKNGARSLVVKIVNTSDSPRQIELSAHSLAGEEFSGLQISQDSLEIQPQRSQSIRLTMRTQRDILKPQWGLLEVRASSNGKNSKAMVPVAMLSAPPQDPNVEFSELTAEEQAGRQQFRLSAANHGDGFAPVHGSLEITDEQGHRMTLTAGFGKWIYPGQSSDLVFRPDFALQPGKYQLVLMLQTFDNLPPNRTTKVIQLGESTDAAKPSWTAAKTPG